MPEATEELVGAGKAAETEAGVALLAPEGVVAARRVQAAVVAASHRALVVAEVSRRERGEVAV